MAKMFKVHHKNLLSLALETTSDGIWGWHVPSGEAYFSPQYYTMLGYEVNELAAEYATWLKLLHPADIEPTKACINEHIINKSPSYEVEFRLRTKQGNYLWMLGRGKVLEWSDADSPVYIVGSHVNIDTRKRAEQKLALYQKQLQKMVDEKTRELQQTTSLLEATLNAIPDIIGIQDSQHRIIRYNNAGYCFLNKSHEEVVGKRCFELIGRSAQCELCATTLSCRTKEPASVIRYEKSLDVWLDVRAYPILDKEGNITKIIEHLRDITPEKKAEAERQRLHKQLLGAQKMESLGTLAGGIAHDFNNLLMGIQGRVSLMALDQPVANVCAEHLQSIEAYIKRAADLTKQLLGFARGGKYEVKPVDINELMQASISLFGRTRKDIEIYTELSVAPIIVDADKRQIEQVLLNLYINGWQAMSESGSLTLQTAITTIDGSTPYPYQISPGNYAKITITDTGIGMDETTRQKIFEPFFTTKAKGRGTGLGLASAYGIIKNHGGFIHVASSPGKGSTFSILLPLSLATPMPDAKEQGSMTKGKGTILLVDDEQMILDVGQAMLNRLGYQVITAKGGEEAVARVQSSAELFDLVILDMIMPSIDGGKVFDHIQKVRPELVVLLSSGYTIDGQAAALMERGCKGFIQKPFTINELSRQIEKVLTI
jgi:PAS domain S-box-containing protein